MRTYLPCTLALLLSLGCNGCNDSASNADADGGTTTLPDGAVVERDGAIAPPPSDGGVSTGPDDGGNPGLPPGPGASGCAAIAVAAGATVDGAKADTFTWFDAACKKRAVPLIRNDASGALGAGGFARSFTYDDAA